jgi:hypothetical protein
MKFIVGSSVCLFGVALLLPAILFSIFFDIGCGDIMVRAGNANTVETAIVEMSAVVQYLESENLTKGYTSVFYNTPDEDIAYFYENMKSSLAELKNIKQDATSLEKSNMLMKLRETLIVITGKGSALDIPEGISRYPYNFATMLSFCLGVIFCSLGLLIVCLD